MRSAGAWYPDGLFSGVRGGAGERRENDANDASSERADYSRKRVLLLYLRWLVAERRDYRVVYAAFTFSDPVYRELRDCSAGCRSLVWPSRPTKGTMSMDRSLSRGRIWVLIAILAVAAASWLLFHRQVNRFLEVQLFLRSENPREEWFEELARQEANPQEFLKRCWATGKVTHRQLVATFLKENTMPDAPWLGSLEEVILSGTQDADMSVQELALAIMASRQDPHLFDCTEALLTDPDPLVRQLGLDYLRKADAQRGVPAVIPLLDDPDLRVVARVEVALGHWTGQDSGVRVRMAIPHPESEQAYVIQANAEKIHLAAETRKAWWREHAAEFTRSNSKPLHPDPDHVARRPVTDFELKDCSGKAIRLADFKGRPVLINFWATWCTTCLAEIPDLVALQKRLGNQVAILGIALDGVPDEHGHVPGVNQEAQEHASQASLERIEKTVARAVKARGINYTVLLDPNNAVGGRFNGGELPTTVIIDASGGLRRRFIGERNLQVFEAMIKEAERVHEPISK
jgi:thiol-disulfide isomerase/thioredoxin